jgi:Uncharacterized proteins of the AP superfamily
MVKRKMIITASIIIAVVLCLTVVYILIGRKTSPGVSNSSNIQINIINFHDNQIVHSDAIILNGKVDRQCDVSINGENVLLTGEFKFTSEVKLRKGTNMIKIEADDGMFKTVKTVNLIYEDKRDYVVYINWDGFAWYYYTLANKDGETSTPVISSLAKEGVLFTNAYTGIPSITNPMQTAIVTGTWPAVTGNCYRYYDKETNQVIQFGRENKAETIAEAAVRQGLKVASVQQFILENRGTKIGDAGKPYIQDENADYSVRFDTAIKLIKGEAFGNGPQKVKTNEIPQFIAIYMDDLDGIGHNDGPTYGVPSQPTEKERLQSISKRLGQMDKKLGEFIQACKDRGIYEDMTFVLTADHGMAPYGQQSTGQDEYGHTKLLDLINTIQSAGYRVKFLDKGQGVDSGTDIAMVGVGLQVQISFSKDYTQEDIQKIIDAVKDKPYVGVIMKKDEMKERGVMEGYADLLISPKPPYSFKTDNRLYTARGQHDSLDESAQHIFSMMWGRGVKEGYVYSGRIYNIDFARTMTKLLSLDGPRNATGKILEDALIID